MNTAGVADYCCFNGLPRSGAKYKLIASLREHVQMAAFKAEDSVISAALNANANKLTPMQPLDQNMTASALIVSKINADFESKSMSFAGASKCYAKHMKIAQTKAAGVRMHMTLAATRGVDYHIYKAITGPKCKLYNGSRGELGIDLHEQICGDLRQLLIDCATSLTQEELVTFLTFCNGKTSTKCEPYGFRPYAFYMSSDILSAGIKERSNISFAAFTNPPSDATAWYAALPATIKDTIKAVIPTCNEYR